MTAVPSSLALVIALASAAFMDLAVSAAPQAASEKAESDEPNAAYVGWASFKPGAWRQMRRASLPDAEIREVLKSVTSTEAVIEVRRRLPNAGSASTELLKIPARIKRKRGGVEVKVSEEVLPIDGKQVRCRVERGPVISIWYAPEIPGGMAKMQSPFTLSWVVAWGERP